MNLQIKAETSPVCICLVLTSGPGAVQCRVLGRSSFFALIGGLWIQSLVSPTWQQSCMDCVCSLMLGLSQSSKCGWEDEMLLLSTEGKFRRRVVLPCCRVAAVACSPAAGWPKVLRQVPGESLNFFQMERSSDSWVAALLGAFCCHFLFHEGSKNHESLISCSSRA